MYRTFDYWVTETVFERLVSTCGSTSCLVDSHYVDIYAVLHFLSSGMFVPVPDWWHGYECSKSLLVPTAIILVYNYIFVLSRRATELVLQFVVFYFCIFALVFCFRSYWWSGWF